MWKVCLYFKSACLVVKRLGKGKRGKRGVWVGTEGVLLSLGTEAGNWVSGRKGMRGNKRGMEMNPGRERQRKSGKQKGYEGLTHGHSTAAAAGITADAGA